MQALALLLGGASKIRKTAREYEGTITIAEGLGDNRDGGSGTGPRHGAPNGRGKPVMETQEYSSGFIAVPQVGLCQT